MKQLLTSRFQKYTIITLLLIAMISLMLPATYSGIKMNNIFSSDAYGKFMFLGLVFSAIVVFFHENLTTLFQCKNKNIIPFVILGLLGVILWRNILLLIATMKELDMQSHVVQNIVINGVTQNTESGIAIGFYLVIISLLLAIICFFIFSSTEKSTHSHSGKTDSLSQK